MLKRILALSLFVLTLFLIGCGGGGGGTGGGNGGSSGGTFGPIHVEANDSSGHFVDPANLQVGDHVSFVLAHYDTVTHARKIVASNGDWSTNDLGAQAGTLSSSGAFVATAPSATTYAASATASSDGFQYQSSYKVSVDQAIVKGTVSDSNGRPVFNATVVFNNSGGTEVGRASSSPNGSVYASVPTSAVSFTILSGSLNPTFYQGYFVYNLLGYSTLIPTCTAPLPALTNGVTTNLATVITVAATTDINGVQQPPPPPPTGCH